MLAYGNSNRTQHPTDANAQSSRSHAVFTVYVSQQDRTANISTEIRQAKLVCVLFVCLCVRVCLCVCTQRFICY